MRLRYKNLLRTLAASGVILIYQNCAPGFSVSDGSSSNSSLGSSGPSVGNAKVRRLSNLEYKNSVIDLSRAQIARHGNNGGALDNLNYGFQTSFFNELPTDQLATKLGTDQISANISSARFSAYTDLALSLGTTVTSSNYWMQSFVGCATVDTDVSNMICIDQFIDDFATQAFRAPPTVAERAELKKNLTNWHTLIARILNHPRFLLHIERDGARMANGSFALTDYEIEARLAAVFWKSVPDAAGIAVAKGGTLRTPAGLQAEITRILNSQKAHDTLWGFYRQWFATQRLPQAGSYDSGPQWEAFAADLPIPDTRVFGDAVLEDGHQFLEYLTWTQPSKLEALFRSPLLFTTDPTVARIYGVSPRANSSAPPLTDTTGHFAGILTRPMITQQKPSNYGDTNHIQRGVFILQNILGLELGQPANFADQQQAQLIIPITSSTRQEVQAKTGQGACIACHSMINPVGFGLAHFDSLGRYITTEKRYNYQNNVVTAVATNPVDSSSTLNLNGESYGVSDSITLVDVLFGTGRAYQGFANYYFQYAFGHLPNSPSDLQIVADLKANLKSKTIRGALESLAMSPDFAKTQTVNP